MNVGTRKSISRIMIIVYLNKTKCDNSSAH